MSQPYRAFIVQARAPAFSIRQPQTYQVGASLPLPQPSTLVCALAYAAALTERGPTGSLGDEYVGKLAESMLQVLVRVTAKPAAPLTSSLITVSRVRALERSSEEVMKDVKSGRRISDAMVREYYSGRLTIIYVFRNVASIERAYSWLHLLGRIGDTESLLSLESVEEALMEPLGTEQYVDTYTPLEWVESYGEGVFSLTRMCKEELCAKPVRRREDYEKYSSAYIVPLAERWVGTERRGVLEGAQVYIRTKRGYAIWRMRGTSTEAKVVLPEVRA
jgi:CRISPR-associated protein Cas5 subtype I-A